MEISNWQFDEKCVINDQKKGSQLGKRSLATKKKIQKKKQNKNTGKTYVHVVIAWRRTVSSL